MGTINIDVPGDLNLKFKVESMEVINQIIRIMKDTGLRRKSKNTGDDIIGIWKDRFDEKISSDMLQKELREKTWKRF
jgi:hypothetical protein